MTNKLFKCNETTILIVLYKETYELVSKTLEQLKSYQVIIIDNGNDHELKNKIESLFQIETYILNKNNNGFSAGYNQAIKLCRTKFCLILGPDCIIKKESVIKLHEAYLRYDNCFMVTPTSYNKSGDLTYSGGPLPEKSSKDKILNLEGDTCVESALGACMFVKTKDLSNVNMFDENLFIYFSDDDLCRKIKKMNRSIIQIRDATCLHTHGILKMSSTFSKIFIREYNLTYDGLYYYYKGGNKNFYLKIRKKIISYFLKFFFKLFLLKLNDSVRLFSIIYAYFRFYIKFKWRGGREV